MFWDSINSQRQSSLMFAVLMENDDGLRTLRPRESMPPPPMLIRVIPSWLATARWDITILELGNRKTLHFEQFGSAKIRPF